MLKIKSILILFFLIAIVSSGVAAILMQQLQDDNYIKDKKGSGVEAKISVYQQEKDYSRPEQTHIQKEDASDDKVNVADKKNRSVLKSSSGFVTVFYVLVNYLFSSPFEAQVGSSLN